MKKRFLLSAVAVLLASGVFAAPTFADVGLFDWAFNIDGVLTTPGSALPGGIDASGFDFSTGLGTITVSVIPNAPASHFVGLFVDHEIDESENTFFNEYGAVSGTPAAGQSWEIDEPGYVFGDIYVNITAGTLDGINAVPAGSEDDVSMAMGWNFDLTDMPALATFTLSNTAPAGGFFLRQYDPDSDVSVYFSSDLSVVPLPGAALLAVLGLGAAGGLLRRVHRRKTQD